MVHAAFGSFNPNFYGMSLAYGGQTVLDAMADYARTDDLDAWEEDQPDFELARIGVISTPDHEMRHFHDFLLSPFAAQSMVSRLQATANGASVLEALPHMPGQFLPTPMTRWISWSAAERQAWFDSTGRYAGMERLDQMVPLPCIDLQSAVTPSAVPFRADELAQHFAKLTEATARGYISLENGRARQDFEFGMELSATDMFEGTAHLTQLSAIWMGQGRKAVDQFALHLLTSDLPILKAFQVLKHGWFGPDDFDQKRMLEMFTWVLMGPRGGDGDHPALRYGLLLILAMKAKDEMARTLALETGAFWDLLDQITGQPPWRENLVAAHDFARSRVDRIEAAFSALGDLDPFPAMLIRVARRWERDVAQMHRVICGDPGSYFDLVRYLQDGAPSLPRPYTLIHYGNGAINPAGGVPPSETRRDVFLRDGRRDLLYSIAAPAYSKPPEGWAADKDELDAVFEVHRIQKIIDFLFYEEATTGNLDQFYLQTGKSMTGKTILHVF